MQIRNSSLLYKIVVSAGVFMGSNAYSQGLKLQAPSKQENKPAIQISETPVALKPLSPLEVMSARIQTVSSDPVLRGANWGFVVYDPMKNKVIAAHNEATPLVPASTTKILTTETALAHLGANYHWVTQLEYSGEIAADGVLNGDLYFVGSGDPSIGTAKAGASGYASLASQFASAVATAGIKKVNGKIVVQSAVFKDYPVSQLPKETVWMEYKNYYVPAGSTQNINESKSRTISKSSKYVPGIKRYYYVSPSSGKMAYTEDFNANTLTAVMPTAPEYLAKITRTELVKKGISVPATIETRSIEANPIPRITLYKYTSPSLHDIMTYTNLRSDNALAEAFLKVNGFFIKGSYSMDKGREAVTEHLRSNGFDTSELVYIDGSGLSRSHRVTPISQAKYLGKLMKEKYYRDFFETLPTAGESGTLKSMFTTSPARGRVFAKTGTLNGVKTLAGYIKTNSGKMYTFSILLNGYKGSVNQAKAKIQQLLEPALDL